MNKNIKRIGIILIILCLFLIIFLELKKEKKENVKIAIGENYHIPFGIKDTCDQIIKREAFEVCYDYKRKNPKWVSYTITKESVSVVRKRENRFYEDKEIPKEYRAVLKDYKKSGYDRGHMMPNATGDYSKTSQKETFFLSNMTPQHPRLNRQGWARLEAYVRELAVSFGTVNVVTGALYDEKREYIGNRVDIPDYLYKVMYIPSQNIMYAFLMPNSEVKKSEFKNYRKSVNEIEALTRIDFFNMLDDEVENVLEK